MSAEPPNGNGVTKGIQSLMGYIIAALLLWAGATLISQGNNSAENRIRIETLERQALMIVPRAEYERRHSDLDSRVERQERIIESVLFGAGKKAQARE